MTLQIGLVALDGFVIASDRKAVRNPRELPPMGRRLSVRSSSRILKILSAANGGLVCAFSGDDLSMVVAQGLIVTSPKRFDNDAHVEEYLTATSREIISRGKNPEGQQIIAALPNSQGCGRLWHLRFVPHPVAQVEHERIYGGDEGNPAAYLIERYYRPSYSVDCLKLLAAHFVIEGARFSSFVADLDVLISKSGELPYLLPEIELDALKLKSAQFGAAMDNFLQPPPN